MLNYCYKIGCYLIIIQPSLINKTIPKWKIVRRTVKKLKEISKLAFKEDINIGFEFIAQPNSSVGTLEQTKEIMNQLKSQENLGYIIDTFYLSKTKEPFENLKEVRDFIYLIQLSDHLFKNYDSREEILESDEENRLLPGEGDFDFQTFLKYTRKLHYLKPFSIELSQEINMENLYYKTLQNLDLPIMRRK
jgi:sugar phosphate isomerase/epimerase